MGEMMEFPKTIKEFIDDYKFKDRKQIYTNGSELIQVYRVEQALEHYDYENRITKLEKSLDKACELLAQYKNVDMPKELAISKEQLAEALIFEATEESDNK